MKRKLITTTVFLFGLAMGGATASASTAKDAPVQGITEEMAQCVSDCKAGGQSHTICWNCCVRNICIEL